LLKRGI